VFKDDLEIPVPNEKQVLIQVKAATLNPADYKLLGNPKILAGKVPGLDGSGVVESVGDQVQHFKKGDRVYFHAPLFTKWGTFAEYCILEEHQVFIIPELLSFIDAASVPCASWTAYEALYDKMNVQKGRTILITAGAGGVGMFAIQMANHSGLEVITSCSSGNFDFVKQLGAQHVIDYNKEDVAEAALKLTNGRGVDYILECVSADSSTSLLKAIAFYGQMTVIVGSPITKPEDNLFSRAISIHHVFLVMGNLYPPGAPGSLGHVAIAVGKLFEEKILVTHVDKVIELDQIQEALKTLRERHVRGKIVAKIH